MPSFVGAMDKTTTFGVLDFEEAVIEKPKLMKQGTFLWAIREVRGEQRQTQVDIV